MRKVAFLVANDECPEDTEIPKLLYPKSDAEALAEILADRETCGFEPHVYVNKPSYKVLEELFDISGQLTADDTLLFYYSGHGMRRVNELCLVSSNTKLARLTPTSIKTTEVLGYLRESYAKRRILILDCCYSGVIGLQYKAADSDSSLDSLGNDFGTCILTASTSIQLAEEREKDGHGLFTKALIDCLREPRKVSISVDDWYLYAVDQLRVSGSQKPTKCGYVEGYPIEIGNFSQRFARLRQQELERWISAARDKLMPYVGLGDLTEADVEEVVALLKRDEATLLPHHRIFREGVIRFLKGEARFRDVFGTGHIPRSEPTPIPRQDEPPEPPDVERSVTPPEPLIVGILRGSNKRAIFSLLGGAAIAVAAGIWWFFPFVGEHKDAHDRTSGTAVIASGGEVRINAGPSKDQIDQILQPLAEQLSQKDAQIAALTKTLPEKNPAAGDPVAGEAVYTQKCKVCHQIGEFAYNFVGPELNGLIGRKAGSAPNYNYTDTNKESGITWDEATLKDYLVSPKAKIPGTKMIFAGLPKKTDRDNLVAYLAQFDADGKKK